MEINQILKKWRDDGKYCPPILRNFHDQKDIFKMIHRTVLVEKHEYCSDISWIKGQCYVIDIFLWAMAKYGYTLQRSRAKVPFESLEKVLKICETERLNSLSNIINVKNNEE